jgi:soluble lytic murein transglycosylase-like protein
LDLRQLIASVEKEFGIPTGLLKAIAQIESGLKPYAVNVSKKAHYFSDKNKAEKFVLARLEEGHTNISVGCLQILYIAHKGGFGYSVERMLDPEKNIKYAAGLLKRLRDRYGSWSAAVRKYHSSSSKKSSTYYNKVIKKLGRSV